MAKISAYGATSRVQIKAFKYSDDSSTKDGKVHLTLTLTSDGRVLRKIIFRYATFDGKGTYTSGGNYSQVTKVKRDALDTLTNDEFETRLRTIAARWGYVHPE